MFTHLYSYSYLVCWACTPNNIKNAPEITYYFEVKCGSPQPTCIQLKQYLEKNIPQYKYAITNQSGKKWPYYETFETSADVHGD